MRSILRNEPDPRSQDTRKEICETKPIAPR
jgi:hypothetical protein